MQSFVFIPLNIHSIKIPLSSKAIIVINFENIKIMLEKPYQYKEKMVTYNKEAKKNLI